MKRIIILLLVFSVVFLSACNSISSSINTEENKSMIAGSYEQDQEDDSGSKNNEQEHENKEQYEAPAVVVFQSLDQLNEFGSLNDSSFDEEKEFFMKHPEATLISEDELSKMISLTNKSFIPDAHYFGTKIDQFGGTYYSDRHELELVYSIKGVRYRFIYSYGRQEQSMDRTPVCKCNFDKYSVGLYETDGCYLGLINTDYAAIRIIVYTDDLSSILIIS